MPLTKPRFCPNMTVGRRKRVQVADPNDSVLLVVDDESSVCRAIARMLRHKAATIRRAVVLTGKDTEDLRNDGGVDGILKKTATPLEIAAALDL